MLHGTGKKLRTWRKSRKLTLDDVCRSLKVSKAHLSRIERGLVAGMDVELAFRIQELTGIGVERWRGERAA